MVGTDDLAVIHYKAPSEGSAVIDINQVYLCDSGAQYLDGMYFSPIGAWSHEAGTTDTTRTMVSHLADLLDVSDRPSTLVSRVRRRREHLRGCSKVISVCPTTI